MEAIPAINGFGTIGLEGHLGVYAAASANSVKHSALRTIVSTAVTTTIAITTITALFCGAAARLALSGRLETLGFVELAFFLGKLKIGAASCTGNVGS